jgi:hypothetical protein
MFARAPRDVGLFVGSHAVGSGITPLFRSICTVSDTSQPSD